MKEGGSMVYLTRVVLVAALGGLLFGYDTAVIAGAIMFLVSAIGTAVPKTLMTFVIFRFLGGVGVGAASMTSPMYIAEISPARIRGRMVSVNQRKRSRG